jgi:hypothetical protein
VKKLLPVAAILAAVLLTPAGIVSSQTGGPQNVPETPIPQPSPTPSVRGPQQPSPTAQPRRVCSWQCINNRWRIVCRTVPTKARR